MSNTTWRAELTSQMSAANDPGPVIHYAPDEAAFDVTFNDDFGSPEGPSVLAWTESYVYFPVCYDGSEYLASVPRNPQPDGVGHVGGW